MQRIENNVEAFRYYLALKSGQFQSTKIIDKMAPALVFVIYLSGNGWTIYIHKAWDHCSIIGRWAVQSLKAVIDDGPHAFLFNNAERRGQGGKNSITMDYLTSIFHELPLNFIGNLRIGEIIFILMIILIPIILLIFIIHLIKKHRKK